MSTELEQELESISEIIHDSESRHEASGDMRRESVLSNIHPIEGAIEKVDLNLKEEEMKCKKAVEDSLKDERRSHPYDDRTTID